MQDRRLSILFLPSWYPSREHATIGNFIQRHAEAVAFYQKVTVVAGIESDTNELEVSHHGNLTEIRVYFRKKLPLFSYQKAMQRGIDYAKKKFGQFDLAHVHVAYPAGVLALTLDMPYVLTEHFSGYHPQSGFKWSLPRKSLTRRILNRAEIVLPVSDHLGKALREFGCQNEFYKVSNVVDTALFYPAESLPGTFTFLHISSLEERSKNITGILRGFKKLEQKGFRFCLKIGGDGDLEELRKKIAIHGPSVSKTEIIPAMEIDKVGRVMRQAHALVMFSHFENQPCTILEALCSGLPVVSSAVGGIPEVLDRSNGILVKAENLEDFIHGLESVIMDYYHFRRQAIASEAAQLYSYRAVGKELSDIYLSVLR